MFDMFLHLKGFTNVIATKTMFYNWYNSDMSEYLMEDFEGIICLKEMDRSESLLFCLDAHRMGIDF